MEEKQAYGQHISIIFTFSDGFHKKTPCSQAGVTNGTTLAITIPTEHFGRTIASPQLTVLVLLSRF